MEQHRQALGGGYLPPWTQAFVSPELLPAEEATTEERVVSPARYLRRCKWCGCEHDTGKVTVLARYADCSVWACPGCGTQIDDRPAGWGGSYPVERRPTTVVRRCPNSCYTNGICTCRSYS